MVFSLGTFPRGAFVALDGLQVGIGLPAEPARHCWSGGLFQGHFAYLCCARNKRHARSTVWAGLLSGFPAHGSLIGPGIPRSGDS